MIGNFKRDMQSILGGPEQRAQIRKIDTIPGVFHLPVTSSKVDRIAALDDPYSGIYVNDRWREYLVVVMFQEIFPINLGGFTEELALQTPQWASDHVDELCKFWVESGDVGAYTGTQGE